MIDQNDRIPVRNQIMQNIRQARYIPNEKSAIGD